MKALERMLAARYLVRERPRTALLHVVSGVLLLVALQDAALFYWLSRYHRDYLAARPMLRLTLHWVIAGAPGAIVWFAFLIELIRRLTIFAAISTVALYWGTTSMVMVLSIMSGFEKDLQSKILGANAHIVVSAPDRAFTGWRDAERRLAGIPGVVGVTPFLSTEVMISSQSNLSGVVLKGIDPASVGAATDLSRNLEQGSLDNLVHPEKLEAPGLLPELRRPPPPAVDGDDDQVFGPLPPPAPLREHKVLPAVLIGKELAKTLRAYLGEEVSGIL